MCGRGFSLWCFLRSAAPCSDLPVHLVAQCISKVLGRFTTKDHLYDLFFPFRFIFKITENSSPKSLKIHLQNHPHSRNSLIRNPKIIHQYSSQNHQKPHKKKIPIHHIFTQFITHHPDITHIDWWEESVIWTCQTLANTPPSLSSYVDIAVYISSYSFCSILTYTEMHDGEFEKMLQLF